MPYKHYKPEDHYGCACADTNAAACRLLPAIIMTVMASPPCALHSYEYTWRVAANDLYEGLARVSDVFVGTTLTALDELDLLHTYLLIASIVVFVGLVLLVLVPFKKRLVTESVRLAGLLSQLPQVRSAATRCAARPVCLHCDRYQACAAAGQTSSKQ